jgi:hypothetical protein
MAASAAGMAVAGGTKPAPAVALAVVVVTGIELINQG